MICPNCKREVSDSSMFCPDCGTKIERETLCPACGKPVFRQATFCQWCGNPLQASRQERRQPPVAHCATCGKPVPPGETVCADCRGKETQRKGLRTAVIAVCIVLLVIGGAAGGLYLFGQSLPSGTGAQQTETETGESSLFSGEKETDEDSLFSDAEETEESGQDSVAEGDEYLLLSSTSEYTGGTVYHYEYSYIQGNDGSAKEKYYLFEYYTDTTDSEGATLFVYSYDDEGYVATMTEYPGAEVVNYEYDAAGNLISETCDTSDSYNKVYEYDASGNLVSEATAYYEMTYEYDAEGNRIKSSFYFRDTLQYSYEYDGDGNMTGYLTYDENGDCTSTIKYEYNEVGEAVAQIIYDEDGQVTDQGEYEYTYDENGNRKGGSLYFGDILTEFYEYDEAGNLLMQVRYKDSGEEVYRIENTYAATADYFREKKDTSFDSYEEIAAYMADAIFELDGEGILENLYDGVLMSLRAGVGNSIEELAETLEEAFEDNFDDAMEDADWQECETSWKITNWQLCPTEEYEMLIDEFEYPEFAQDQVWRLDLDITVSAESGEKGEVGYYIYVVEENGKWYIWMLGEEF